MRLLRAMPLLLLVAADAPAGRTRYVLDPAGSVVSAKVAFFGISSKTARFPKMGGAIALDPARPQAIDLTIELDARALTAPDPVTLRRLKGPKFFWVERYPTVSFRGNRLALASPTSGTVQGVISARGVIQPATLAVTFSPAPAQAAGKAPLTVTGITTIDRRAFGMTAYGRIVGRKVTIRVRARMRPG